MPIALVYSGEKELANAGLFFNYADTVERMTVARTQDRNSAGGMCPRSPVVVEDAVAAGIVSEAG